MSDMSYAITYNMIQSIEWLMADKLKSSDPNLSIFVLMNMQVA